MKFTVTDASADPPLWDCLRAYGELFRPWLKGVPNPDDRLIDGKVLAPMLKVVERYGTRSALAWALSTQRCTSEVERYAKLTLLYSREKAARRHNHILALAEAINGAEVAPLLLKGSAMQIADIYPDPGFRLMADIDLLVPIASFEACESAAAGIGFAVREAVGREHANQQYLAEEQGLLELHRHLTRLHSRDNFPPSRMFDTARPLAIAGARMLRPDWAHHVVLVILHAFEWDGDRHKARVPLKAMLDLACLKKAGVVDWDAVPRLMAEIDETECLVHAEALFEYLFGLRMTGIEISSGKYRRVLGWYAIGANHRIVTHAALAASHIRRRMAIGMRKPGELKKLMQWGFYRRLACAIYQAFDPRNPLA